MASRVNNQLLKKLFRQLQKEREIIQKAELLRRHLENNGLGRDDPRLHTSNQSYQNPRSTNSLRPPNDSQISTKMI